MNIDNNVANLAFPKQLVKRKRARSRIMLGYKSPKRVRCNFCGVTCLPKTISNHLKYTHGNEVYQCLECDKLFSRPHSCQKHVQMNHSHVTDSARHYRIVDKRGVPQHLLPVMKKLPEPKQKLKHPLRKQHLLPQVSLFNCYDCDGSFYSCQDLFTHCKESHRTSEAGKPYRYLVSIAKKKK